MATPKQTPFDFFYENAGYGYDPKTQTEDEGRRECAQALADAERESSNRGYCFYWENDIMTNREFTNEGPEYYLWACTCYDDNGAHVSSMCGVDFGHGNTPWGQPYRRVVEAELALEAIANA